MQFRFCLVSIFNSLPRKFEIKTTCLRLIVIVSVERTTAVIWPLKARNFWTSKTLFFLVIGIWICSIILSFHWHITHEVTVIKKPTKLFNETTGEEYTEHKPYAINKLKIGMEKYWSFAILSEMISLVFIPVVLVLSSNTMMIIALRQQNRQHNIHIKRQRRATLIVIIIASTFTISQMPSALIHLTSLIYPEIRQNEQFRIIAALTNSLVVMGKTANFFLFCTWSSYFRKNLYRVISMKMPCLYRFCEKGMTRFRSTSSLGDSGKRHSNRRLQRLQSVPLTNVNGNICSEHLKVKRSLPLNIRRTSRKTETMVEEIPNDEASAFLEDHGDNRLTQITDF